MRLGLIGYPLGHSFSRPMHRAALQHVGLDWTYENLPVQAADLPGQVQALRSPEWRGVNVTAPHKQSVLTYLDDIGPVATVVGAVNCISIHNGRLVGSNTDVPALERELTQLAGPCRGRAVWILGAGGAARAVVFTLLKQRTEVTVVCRRREQGEELAGALAGQGGEAIRVLPWSPATLASAPRGALIVNTTPLGTFPDTSGNPWPEAIPLPDEAVIYDLVYNPAPTALVARARAVNMPAANGAGMLLEQGALAFERWTGLPAPRSVMRFALEKAMEVQDAQIPDGW